ncbi:unnamed protein product [Ilex paraguariensis]|uniref:SBP-type domain-containing protein n=1 Tax=Ilex paraguariensis TaxID=185542 RepID=A0ABC8UKP5_9AQUA
MAPNAMKNKLNELLESKGCCFRQCAEAKIGKQLETIERTMMAIVTSIPGITLLRFHQLPEFDQGKRSCRRRLAGHNERRRKPPAGSLLSSRYGSLGPSIFG